MQMLCRMQQAPTTLGANRPDLQIPQEDGSPAGFEDPKGPLHNATPSGVVLVVAAFHMTWSSKYTWMNQCHHLTICFCACVTQEKVLTGYRVAVWCHNGHGSLQAWVPSITQQEVPSWWVQGLPIKGRTPENEGIMH